MLTINQINNINDNWRSSDRQTAPLSSHNIVKHSSLLRFGQQKYLVIFRRGSWLGFRQVRCYQVFDVAWIYVKSKLTFGVSAGLCVAACPFFPLLFFSFCLVGANTWNCNIKQPIPSAGRNQFWVKSWFTQLSLKITNSFLDFFFSFVYLHYIFVFWVTMVVFAKYISKTLY